MRLPFVMVPEPVVALGVCAKVTLVLVLAWGVAARTRRAPAATRHRVWALATAVALALVASSPLAPRIPVRVPIQFASHRGLTVHLFALALEVCSTLWLVGAIAVLAQFAAGHLALARLAFAARRTPLHLPHRDPLARGLRAHGARVRWSAGVHVPLTWGVFRPVVLVPAAARAWPASRLRAALRHELAHVARRDLLAQALGALLCTLFWFNPLAWYALDRLRAECEFACDDEVLAAGVGAVAYASHLLAVARPARPARPFAVTAPMAARPDLEGRVRAILDPRRARFRDRRAEVVFAIVAILLLLPLASLRTQVSPRSDLGRPSGTAAHR